MCVCMLILLGLFQLLNLFDEVSLLIVELFILGPIRVELGQKVH